MNLDNGTIIGNRYEIAEKIGTGGMANVYKAKDIKLNRFVTFKVLKEEYVRDEDFVKRFSVEAQAAAKLSHPNIVTVYDFGNDGNVNYIVMEYIDGFTLKEFILKKAPFANDQALGVAIQIASALENAHENGIVHRDIKPQNIMVTKDGSIKVTDFGIARAINSNTTTTESMGSVQYFSPEQARGVYVDGKSDIYSLGIVMYEMITGRLPFDGDSPVQLAMKHINDPLPNMRIFNQNVSASVEKIILKATEKVSTQRYQTAEELNNDLKRALTNESGDFIKNRNYSNDSPTVVITKEDREAISRQTKTNVNDADSPKKINIYNPYQNNYENDEPYEPYEPYEPDDPIETDKQDEPVKPLSYEDRYKKISRYNGSGDNYDKSKEKRVIIAAVVTAFAIIAIITSFGAWFLNKSNSPDIEAPVLLGHSLEEAQEIGNNLKIYIKKAGESYSDKDDVGIIIKQSIEPGAKMKEGDSIDITISLGAEPATETEYKIPHLVGKDMGDIEDEISDNVKIKYQYEYDDKVPLGQVISQDPEAGKMVKANSVLNLTISKGVESRTTIVPNCVGKTKDTAVALLESSDLKVGSIINDTSTVYEEGYVIQQTVDSGIEVKSGTSVTLVVSSGKLEEEKPKEKEDNKENDKEDKEDNSKENDDSKTEEPLKTASITVNPVIEEGLESVEVKLVEDNGSSTGKEVYSNIVNVSEFPLSINVQGNKTSEFQLYINGRLSGKQKVDF